MGNLKRTWQRLQQNEDGQSLVEFGLIVTCVACVAMAGLGVLGDEVVKLYTDVTNLFN